VKILMYLAVYNQRQLMYNITNEDYKFVERPEDVMYTVELTTGEYKGTKYQYGKVSAKVEEINDDEDGIASLSFMWNLIEGDDALQESPDFQNYIGDVLSHILQDAFDSGEYKIGNDDDTKRTDNDSAEPINQ
jgi:hypothetical protein